MNDKKKLHCSICRRSKDEAIKMVSHGKIVICNFCVMLMVQTMIESPRKENEQ